MKNMCFKFKFLLFIFLFSVSLQSCKSRYTYTVAHRGAWKNTETPQNSLASLEEAFKQRAWGSEFDVQLTKDDVLVVNHDPDFYGIDIATSTYEQLLSIKLSNGEVIPKVEDFLKFGSQNKAMKLVLELKANRLGKKRTLESVDLVYELVKRYNAFDFVDFITFDYDACLRLRQLDNTIQIHYLTGDKSPQQIYDAKLSGIDYHFDVLKRNPEWIEQCKQLGLKVNVWTVNRESDMLHFINQKVDYITTDEPEILQKLIQTKKP